MLQTPLIALDGASGEVDERLAAYYVGRSRPQVGSLLGEVLPGLSLSYAWTIVFLEACASTLQRYADCTDADVATARRFAWRHYRGIYILRSHLRAFSCVEDFAEDLARMEDQMREAGCDPRMLSLRKRDECQHAFSLAWVAVHPTARILLLRDRRRAPRMYSQL